MKLRLTITAVIMLMAVALASFALTPNEVLVVYNNQEPDPLSDDYALACQVVPASEGVAKHYAAARGIPADNLLGLPAARFTEFCTTNEYLATIATPISNYLSTHPNIKCIVLCYGVPCQMACSGLASIDSALMLLGNTDVLNVEHWRLDRTNPYYNSNMRFDEFVNSPSNTVAGPNNESWKINYLVCRLDGYASPTTPVTIDSVTYNIPSDIKAMIDRAVSADAAGRAGLTNAKVVLDDAPGTSPIRQYSSALETSINDLLYPITGSQDNVWRDPNLDSYIMNKSHIIANSSNGSYDRYAAPLVTTWWRPFNTYEDGAVGIFWNVSGDGYHIRTPDYIHTWDSHQDTEDVEAHTLKVTWENFSGTLETSSLYDGHWLCLCDYNTQAVLKRVNFVSGVARMDLSDIQWPQDNRTYVEFRFPDDDPNHPGELIDKPSIYSYEIYNARSTGYTWRFGLAQSLASDLIREGCSAVTANVGEPGPNCVADPSVVFPRYFSGYSWAESAWMGIPEASWMQVAIGDPLMAPFAVQPTCSLVTPSPTSDRNISGKVSLYATASPDGDGTIDRVEFWVTSDGIPILIGSDSEAPYECVWDTTETSGGNSVYPDDDYTIEAIAYQTGNIVGVSNDSCSVAVDNASIPSVDVSEPENEDAVVTSAAPVEAQPGGTPTKVEFWLFGEDAPILAGDDTSSPYQCTITSNVASDGIYELQTIAYYDGITATSYSSRRRVVVVNDSTPVTSVSGLGALSDGASVYLVNVPVTAGVSSSMDDAFYVEDSNRATGIRVETTETGIAQGDKVTISGTLDKAGTGLIERRIVADKVWSFGTTTVPQPLGMANLNVGGQAPADTVGVTLGAGLYNTGILVRVWGRVKYVGSNYFYLYDGSNFQNGNNLEGPIIVPLDGSDIPTTHPSVVGLRVYCGTLNKPGIDDYVSITGISSTSIIGSNIVRCIRLRSQDDITYSERYITGRRVMSGIVDSDDNYISVGSKVRMPDDMVYQVYSDYLMIIEMGWAVYYTYAINPAQTQLQYGDTVTVCGTYTAYPGLLGYPEISPLHIYLGGSQYGAMDVGNAGLNTGTDYALSSINPFESPEPGGGSFRPWPYPTAEEILESESFQTQYNELGNIGWVLSQPDNSVLDLRTVAICGDWYDGQALGLREWYEPIPDGANLLLYLDAPIKLEGVFKNIATIDVIGGTLVTLSDGRKALMKPKAVYVYTDSEGRWTPPVPWLKTMSTNGVTDSSEDWPWKTKVAP